MHFPDLVRREEYRKKANGEYYADYHTYYEEIAEDCKHRCVYCDAQLKEIGGEGMHIDHFKPQKHFPDLKNMPDNLVLACARCNQLKSDWWPEKTGNSNGLHGFVDPFDKDRSSYFEVDESGVIIPKKPPSTYFIELLLLNRLPRINIRRQRMLADRANQLINQICQEMENLPKQPFEVAQKRLPLLATALREVKVLLLTDN